MSYRKLFLLYAFILFLFFAQRMHGETAEGPHAVVAKDAAADKRAPDAGKIREKDAKMIADLFPSTSVETVKQQFAVDVPKAIADAKAGNDKVMAEVAAELFGTMAKEYRKLTFANKLAKMITAEKGKEPKDADSLALLEGLTKGLQRLEPDMKLLDLPPAFTTAFDAKKKEVDANNVAYKDAVTARTKCTASEVKERPKAEECNAANSVLSKYLDVGQFLVHAVDQGLKYANEAVFAHSNGGLLSAISDGKKTLVKLPSVVKAGATLKSYLKTIDPRNFRVSATAFPITGISYFPPGDDAAEKKELKSGSAGDKTGKTETKEIKGGSSGTSGGSGSGTTPAPKTEDIMKIFQARKCTSCHEGEEAEAGLDLSKTTLTMTPALAQKFLGKVVAKKAEDRRMPPTRAARLATAGRPGAADRSGTVPTENEVALISRWALANGATALP